MRNGVVEVGDEVVVAKDSLHDCLVLLLPPDGDWSSVEEDAESG